MANGTETVVTEKVKKENIFKRAFAWVKGHKGVVIGAGAAALVGAGAIAKRCMGEDDQETETEAAETFAEDVTE